MRKTPFGRGTGLIMNRCTDACPRCRTPFRKHLFSIIFKDVLECTYCGNIWVAFDLAVVLRFI